MWTLVREETLEPRAGRDRGAEPPPTEAVFINNKNIFACVSSLCDSGWAARNGFGVCGCHISFCRSKKACYRSPWSKGRVARAAGRDSGLLFFAFISNSLDQPITRFQAAPVDKARVCLEVGWDMGWLAALRRRLFIDHKGDLHAGPENVPLKLIQKGDRANVQNENRG